MKRPLPNSEKEIRLSRSARRSGLLPWFVGGAGALLLFGALLPGVPVVGAAPADGSLALILTEVPAGPDAPAPCAEGSRVVLVDPDGGLKVLSGGLRACDPVLDAEAGRLLFSGRDGAEGAWRIWQLDLSAAGVEEGAPVPITSGERSCRSPLFFPDGGAGFLCDGDLYRTTAPVDATAGGEPIRLTSSAGAFLTATLVPDGRLLLETRTAVGEPLLLTAQPDGTWATRWRDEPFPGLTGARPVALTDLLLTTGGAGAEAGLFLASLADPFAPLEPLATLAEGGELRDPSGLPGGDVLVSFRASPGERFRVGRVAARVPAAVDGARKLVDGTDGARQVVGDDDGVRQVEEVGRVAAAVQGHALQPLAVAPRAPDTPLPGIVKLDLNTGYLVLFDAARSDLPALDGIGRGDVAAVRIFPWEDGPRGETAVDVPPAPDGSIHLEVPSDKPYGIALVGRDGDLVGPSGGPFWVRPNERRACVGCHVSTRYAPPNVRPEALNRPPLWVGWGAERHGPRSEFEEGSH